MPLHYNYAVLQILLMYCAAISNYDLYEGYDFGARMSYKEVKKHGLLFFTRHESLTFQYPDGTKITGIACVDISPDKMGVPSITQGGINSSFVKIDLQSQRSTGLRYIVEIFTSSFKRYSPDPIRVDIVFKPS